MRKKSPARSIAVPLAAMLLFWGSLPAIAQQADQALPSVSLAPAETDRSDPNLGGWFVMQIEPGGTSRSKARITNPAEVQQRVKLYLSDLIFAKNGTPDVVDGPQTDVGAWGRFLEPEITVPPRGTVHAIFEINVPKDAEPGDHVGVVVAESDAEPGGIAVIKRVATRVYVTVPGDARRSMEIESFKTEVDSKFWPRQILSTVVLRNTGRIRVHPKVLVKGHSAKGSEVLLARSVEPYVADVKVPWYGGPIGIPVVASAEEGLTRRLNASKFVVPWALLLGLVLLAGAGFLIRRWWLARASRLAQLRADIRRLETLVTQRPNADGPVSIETSDEEDEIAAIIAGLKRAVRTRSQPSLERLALALHETGQDALDFLMEALRDPSDQSLEALIEAAASYGQVAVAAKGNVKLPDHVGKALIAAVTPASEPSVSKPTTGPKRPAPAKPKTSSRSKPKAKAQTKTESKPRPTKSKPQTKKRKT